MEVAVETVIGVRTETDVHHHLDTVVADMNDHVRVPTRPISTVSTVL